MRIVAIRDIVSPIRSNIANAYIDFSQMTASVVRSEEHTSELQSQR